MVSGSLIARFRMQPFIVTLAMMVFARGLARFLTDNEKISRSVRLADGSEHRADAVLSNAEAAYTYAHLVPAEARRLEGEEWWVYAGFIESWRDRELPEPELPERDGPPSDPDKHRQQLESIIEPNLVLPQAATYDSALAALESQRGYTAWNLPAPSALGSAVEVSSDPPSRTSSGGVHDGVIPAAAAIPSSVNAASAMPNLVALLMLSGVFLTLMRDFLSGEHAYATAATDRSRRYIRTAP